MFRTLNYKQQYANKFIYKSPHAGTFFNRILYVCMLFACLPFNKVRQISKKKV